MEEEGCLIDQNSSMPPTCKSGSVGSISVKQFASTENIRSSEITTTCLKKALENISLIRYKKNTENKTDSSKTLLLSQFAHVKDNLAVADHDHNYSIRLLPPLREKHNDSVGTKNEEPLIYQNIITSEDAVVNVLEDNEFNEIIKRKSTSPLNLSPNRTDRKSDDDGSSSSETHLVAVLDKNINYEYEDGKNDPDYIPYFKTKANSFITLAPKMIVRKDNCTNIPLMNDDETPYRKFNKECAVIFRSSNVTPLFMSSGVGFLCAYCNERFLIAANLKFHTINSHVKPGSKRTNLKRTFSNSFFIRVDITNIKCKLCEVPVDSLIFLINHLNSAHNKNIDPEMAQKLVPFVFKSTKYVCCLCTLELFSFKQLSMHTIKEHFRNYICDLCNESFVVKNMLTKHMRTHQKEKSLHTCDLCQRSFRQMSTLTSHKLSVHSIGTKPQLPCHVCNEVFDTRKKRTGHLNKIHSIGTKTLSCEICKKIFSQTSGLKKHIDSVHLGKKWPCEICGKQLAHQGGLNRHLARHESSEKKFQCDICKKFYSTKPNLADHMTIHTKQFKFQCEQCGQKFRQNIALKNHRKSKHENYRCVVKKRKKKT